MSAPLYSTILFACISQIFGSLKDGLEVIGKGTPPMLLIIGERPVPDDFYVVAEGTVV